MNEQDIKIIIFRLLKEIAPDTDPNELDGDENIRETLDIDSFDFLQFVVGLDEQFGFKIPEADYSKITTLNALLSYIGSTEK